MAGDDRLARLNLVKVGASENGGAAEADQADRLDLPAGGSDGRGQGLAGEVFGELFDLNLEEVVVSFEIGVVATGLGERGEEGEKTNLGLPHLAEGGKQGASEAIEKGGKGRSEIEFAADSE